MRLEDSAETAAITATRRGGQSEQHRVGIGVDDLAVGCRRRMVALVDDQQIGRRQFHAIGSDGARIERCDRRDLHRLERSRLETGLDDAMRDSVRVQLAAGLRDDLAAVCEHQNIFPRLDRAFDDGGADDGLAGCRSARR